MFSLSHPYRRCEHISPKLQGVRLLTAGSAGRSILGLPAAGGGDAGAGLVGPSAQGAARFALATAATGHAIVALALKLLQGRTGGGGGGGRGGVGAAGAVATGLGQRGGGSGVGSMLRAVGEVRLCDVIYRASGLIAG